MGLVWTKPAITKQCLVDLADLGSVTGIISTLFNSTDSYDIFNKYEHWKGWAALAFFWDLDHWML